MRKFKINNRVKRKYVRRQHHVSVSHVAKAWNFHLLPLVILGVCLLTFGIVARNLYGNIPLALTIQLPHISLGDSLSAVQTSWSTSINVLATIWSVIVVVVNVVQQGIVAFVSSIYELIKLMDLSPLFGLLKQSVNLITTIMSLIIVQIIRFELIMQSIYIMTSGILYLNSFLSLLFLSEVIYYLFVVSYNSFISIMAVICSFLIVLSHDVASNTIVITKNVLYFLGTPFRSLAVFWLQIKPYVDYFLAHVQMTFTDFGSGVHNLSTITSLKPMK